MFRIGTQFVSPYNILLACWSVFFNIVRHFKSQHKFIIVIFHSEGHFGVHWHQKH